jgi:sugar (pentulose or hexulose) kinase
VFDDVQDAVERCVRVSRVVEPDPAWRDEYAALLPCYRELYPALRA